jgi:hypothetical protein
MQECRRSHDESTLASVRQQPSERGDEGTIGRPKRGPCVLASQHRRLVPQHDQFDVLGEFGLPTANQQP